MIGQTVGNYRITKLLGEGGMGAVYLAEHPGIGRKAAVKILHPHLARDTEIVSRFLNEARAANAIRHPGIVEIFDSGTMDSGAPYIAMEALEGESLGARIKRGRVPIREVIEIGRQAAAALGAAHSKGIVHRDLKPDNLFLVPDFQRRGSEQVKILDFGIAKLSQGPFGSGSVRTRTGAVMGTPLYMSPEQCRGTREIDQRSDVYSLGVILYEMLCGQPPFFSEGFGELAHLHISARPPPPRQHTPALSRELEQTLLKALEKDPAGRFQSMAEFQRALGGAHVSQFEQAVTEDAMPAPRLSQSLPNTTLAGSATAFEKKISMTGRPPRRMAWVIGGTAALVAVGAVVLSRQELVRKPPPPAPEIAPPVSVATTPPPPSATQPTVKVAVRIDSRPAGAMVVRSRDGEVLGKTPLEESWRLGPGVEKLRLELDGYRPESVQVPLDRGLVVRVELKKEREAVRPSRPKPRPSQKAAAPARPSPPKEAPPKAPAPKAREPVPI
jgi:serine/threonine-protein kinase